MNHNSKVIRVILENPTLTKHDITYALSLKGFSVADVAKELGCDRAVVYRVIQGKDASFDIATFIAAQLGTTTQRLWGNKYAYTPRSTKNISKAFGLSVNTI